MTRIRSIFTDCSLPYWVETARILAEKHNWDVVGWIGNKFQEADLRKTFPDIVFQLSSDARLGKTPTDLHDFVSAPLDEDILTAMAPYEGMAIKMMERFDSFNYFSYPEKIFLYHKIIMIWEAIIERLKPDIIVFALSPHVVYDYILFGICEIKGIRTVMFERTTLDGLIYPIANWHQPSAEILRVYESFKESEVDPEISAEVESYFNRTSGSYKEGMASHMRAVLEDKGQGDYFNHLKNSAEKAGNVFFDPAIKTILRIRTTIKQALNPPNNYYKKRGKPLGVTELNAWTYLRYRYDVHRAKKAIMKAYEDLAVTPDLSQPYIYVALQGQPERQATPNGGVFSNQYLMVDTLSKLLPTGWRIYVKEHIVQLAPQSNSEKSRSPEFYQFIASLPNVELVELKTNSFELIDNAMAVATISGTTGWEAVVRGKPALLFGSSWYRGCEAVFEARSLKTLRQAIDMIAAGYQVDRRKVRMFAAALDRVCIRGYTDKRYEAVTKIPHAVNAARLAEAIYTFTTSNEVA